MFVQKTKIILQYLIGGVMKCSKIISILLIILVAGIAYSQKVIERVDDYILVNMDESSGYKISNIVEIYRLINDTTQYIGKAQIVQFRDSKCAMKIMNEDPEIKIGDFAKSSETTIVDKLYNSYYSKLSITESKRNRIITYMAAGAGVIASGLGYTFYHKASKTYDNYKTADTPSDAVRLYRNADRYNNLSKISFGIGGGLFVFALINEFIAPLTYQEQQVRIHPNVLNRSVSIAINF